MNDDRSAALVIRVWLEGGPDRFRARLTAADTSPEAGAPEEITVAVASTPSDVAVAVSRWLEDYLRHAAESIDMD